jgi:hypothetical protein
MDEEDWDLFEKTLKSNKSNKNSDGKISCEGKSYLKKSFQVLGNCLIIYLEC